MSINLTITKKITLVFVLLNLFDIGDETFYTLFLHDIKEQKEYETALQKANDELEQRVELRTKELKEVNMRLVETVEAYKQTIAKLRLAGKVFENISEAILITDENAHIMEVNRAFTEITGFTKDDVIGANPSIMKYGRHDNEFYAKMWESINKTGSWTGEIWDRRKNGEIYPKWLTINAFEGELRLEILSL
jgi:PAS domain S-box-containing protein